MDRNPLLHDNPGMPLIQACCKALIDGHNLPDLDETLLADVEPEAFGALCQDHRVLLMVYQVLTRTKDNPKYAHLQQHLAPLAKHKLLTQLPLHRLLVEVHELLVEQQIEHVFLKGPLLNQALFGNHILRYSKDLDVLVPRKDVLKADQLLQQAGFSCTTSLVFHTLNTTKDLVYYRKNLPFSIELHWKADYLNALFSTTNWASQKTAITYHGQAFPVLRDEYNFLYLCLHATKHGFNRLHWLLDIVLFIQQKNIDMEALLDLARQHHLEQMVSDTLALADACFASGLSRLTPVERSQALARTVEKQKAAQTRHHHLQSRTFKGRVLAAWHARKVHFIYTNPFRQAYFHLKLFTFLSVNKAVNTLLFHLRLKHPARRPCEH